MWRRLDVWVSHCFVSLSLKRFGISNSVAQPLCELNKDATNLARVQSLCCCCCCCMLCFSDFSCNGWCCLSDGTGSHSTHMCQMSVLHRCCQMLLSEPRLTRPEHLSSFRSLCSVMTCFYWEIALSIFSNADALAVTHRRLLLVRILAYSSPTGRSIHLKATIIHATTD